MTQDQSPRSAQKKSFFEEGMKGNHVLVHLNARAPGVDVPGGLAHNGSLTLKFSYYFQGETTHDDTAITGYLRFGGQYAKCIVPWNTVWGMTTSNGENRVWPEDVPREVLAQMARAKIASVGKKLFGVKDKSSTVDGRQKDAARKGGALNDNVPKADKPKAEKQTLTSVPKTVSTPKTDAPISDAAGSGDPTGPGDSDPPKRPGLKRVK